MAKDENKGKGSGAGPAVDEAAAVPALSVGRIVHAYSKWWEGPRPAVVVTVGDGDAFPRANVFLDGERDLDVLADMRRSSCGNTISGPLLMNENSEDRAEALKQFDCWLEWPPRV